MAHLHVCTLSWLSRSVYDLHVMCRNHPLLQHASVDAL
jgi:hypothetical protein